MSQTQTIEHEPATRLVLQFNDALNRHDVGGMMQLMSDDCVFENTAPAPDGTRYEGKADLTSFWEAFFEASPHAHIDVEELFSLGERCIMRWRYTWTESTGIQGHVRGVDLFRISDGAICEKLSYVKG